jgi:hypothetical protein
MLLWRDEEGNTLLHVAVSKNKPEVSPFHSSNYLGKENRVGILMEVYQAVQRIQCYESTVIYMERHYLSNESIISIKILVIDNNKK